MMTVKFICKADDTIFEQGGVVLLGMSNIRWGNGWRKVWQMKLWDDENGERIVTLPVKGYDLFRVKEEA